MSNPAVSTETTAPIFLPPPPSPVVSSKARMIEFDEVSAKIFRNLNDGNVVGARKLLEGNRNFIQRQPDGDLLLPIAEARVLLCEGKVQESVGVIKQIPPSIAGANPLFSTLQTTAALLIEAFGGGIVSRQNADVAKTVNQDSFWATPRILAACRQFNAARKLIAVSGKFANSAILCRQQALFQERFRMGDSFDKCIASASGKENREAEKVRQEAAGGRLEKAADLVARWFHGPFSPDVHIDTCLQIALKAFEAGREDVASHLVGACLRGRKNRVPLVRERLGNFLSSDRFVGFLSGFLYVADPPHWTNFLRNKAASSPRLAKACAKGLCHLSGIAKVDECVKFVLAQPDCGPDGPVKKETRELPPKTSAHVRVDAAVSPNTPKDLAELFSISDSLGGQIARFAAASDPQDAKALLDKLLPSFTKQGLASVNPKLFEAFLFPYARFVGLALEPQHQERLEQLLDQGVRLMLLTDKSAGAIRWTCSTAKQLSDEADRIEQETWWGRRK